MDILPDTTLAYFESYHQYELEQGNPIMIARAAVPLSLAYLNCGEQGSAKELLVELIPKVEEQKDFLPLLHSIYLLQKIELEDENYQKVIQLGKESIQYHDEIYKYQSQIYDYMAKAAAAIKNYEAAYEYKNDFVEQNSLYEEQQNEDEVNNLEREYKSKEQKTEIQLLKKDNALKNSRQKLLLGLLIGAGLFTLFIGWIYRVTKQKNISLNRELSQKKLIERQAEELKKVDALKTRLFTNISHELRTPLTLIVGRIKNLLSTQSFNEDAIKILNQVLFQTENVSKMTEQIMDLNRANIKEKTILPRKISVKNFTDFLKSKYHLLASYKNIELEISHGLFSDDTLITDPEKLEIIFNNLISNAIKYTDPDGKIVLNSSENETSFIFNLHDTGRGISETDLPNIFERFYQAKSGKIVSEGGIGIGLSMTKKYIELLGGTIDVQSELGNGSLFTVQIPKYSEKIDTKATVEAIEYEIPILSQTKNTVIPVIENDYILVVEDNIEMCDYIKDILEKDYDLLFAHNGKEALTLIEKKIPSLIITDLMMPIMDGAEFVSIVKNNQKFENIPILVITANTNIISELKAFRIGVDDFLLKPYSDNELKTLVYNLLNFYEDRKQENILNKEFFMNSPLQTSENSHLEDITLLNRIETILGNVAASPDTDIALIASELNFSPAHFNRKMKELTGLTPKKYLNETRLLLARRMLYNRDYDSVKAIAYSSGFSSVKTFSRNFKERYGKYPSEYL